ncbi:MAG: right-handed parallel beta-helix repeat-containing protein [Pseudomonadota bacterium]
MAFAAQSETFTVANSNPSGPGSLAQAISDANDAAGVDDIAFSIPGPGPHVIALTSPLPLLAEGVRLDASTQPGSDCSDWPPAITIEIDASGASGDGLAVRGDDVTIKGLTVSGASALGVSASQADRLTITCSFIGTDITGEQAAGAAQSGLLIAGGSGHVIGETSGSVGNLVAGNGRDGIVLQSTTGARVVGNRVGSDAGGNQALGNTGFGINLQQAAGTEILDNLVVGNGGAGVLLEGNSTRGNVLQGNSIGIGLDGETPIPNVEFFGPGGGGPGVGVFIVGAVDNRIGGSAPGEGNVISANEHDGIGVSGGATGIVIEGNLIGTDASGLEPRGNRFSAVAIFSGENTVGGLAPGAGNVLADSGVFGITIDGADNNQVLGNLVGIGIDGITPLGNRGSTLGGTGTGIFLKNANGTQVVDNVVSANARDGILLTDVTTNTTLRGNFVGTDRTATQMLGTGADGIDAGGDSRNNGIGGPNAGDGNTVAFNAETGVELDGLNNAVLSNAVFANVELGIDQGADGRSSNDLGDADGGENNGQNYPELTSATASGTTINLAYRLDSAPENSAYPLRVEFFLADADGEEGAQFLGSDDYDLASAQLERSVQLTPAAAVRSGDLIVATATDADGNTSEFSDAATVLGDAVPDAVFADSFETP